MVPPRFIPGQYVASAADLLEYGAVCGLRLVVAIKMAMLGPASESEQ
jgi:hypothetical protein